MKIKKSNMNVGAAILFFIFSLLFFILTYRFLTIQTSGEIKGEVLAAKAEQKYTKESKIEGKRGTIFDRNGEVIAEDTDSYKLVAILNPEVTTDPKKPKHVVDPKLTAQKLSKYIQMKESEILSIIENGIKENLFQVEFQSAGSNITHQTKNEIEKLELPGITFIRESKRFYPNGIFASHLIGFVDHEENPENGSSSVGKLGIEQLFDQYLAETDGKVVYESDFWGYLLPGKDEKVYPPKNGNNLYLTIDKKIQTFLEDAVSKVDEAYKPKKIMALVADAKTGEILAMTQRPTFHPSTREGIEQSWHNEVVETSFEPGSTMKVFTLAAAIEEGVFNPNATFQSGKYTVLGQSIHDHNYSGWGEITYLEGIKKSSNVAVAYLLELMGADTFRKYLDSFKFGQKTNIGLQNEATGEIKYTWPIEKVTTSFGQGTTVTPLQLVQAMTAITNQGKMIKPHVVDRIEDNDGNVVKKFKSEIIGQPVSAATAKKVLDVLEETVKDGTGMNFQINGYSVAGKTGTAQIPDPNPGKAYLTGHDNYIFSFLGTAPKEDPKLIVYVAVQQPDLDEEKYEGGSVPVSLIFNPVMENSLKYLNIEPQKIETIKSLPIPDLQGKMVDVAQQELEKIGLTPIVIGNGNKVTETYPMKGEVILEGEKVLIKTNGELTAPDMSGWSLRDVMKFVAVSDLNLTVEGSGFVKAQSISPNKAVKKGDALTVKLDTPQSIVKKKKEKKNQKEKKNDSP